MSRRLMVEWHQEKAEREEALRNVSKRMKRRMRLTELPHPRNEGKKEKDSDSRGRHFRR